MKALTSVLGLVSVLGLAVPAPARDVKEDVAKLMKELKKGSAQSRALAADELGHIGAIRAADAKAAVPALVETLKKDKDANVRKAAANALGRMDAGEEAVPALRAALKDKAPVVRMNAASALGQLGADAKDAEQDLVAAQKDKDRGVSRAARMALRSIRSQGK
jgi:HEAT repeat protein